MSGLTLSRLLAADPAGWHAAAAAWKDLAARLDDAAEQFIRSNRDLPDAWPRGAGSLAAHERATRMQAEISNAYHPAQRIYEALDRHAYAVADLQTQANQVIASARQQGLTVDVATMTITAPAAAYQGGALDQTGRQIGAHTADLRTLLDRARELDDLTAACLQGNAPAAGHGFGDTTTRDVSEAEIVQQGVYTPEQVHSWWVNLSPLQQENAIRQHPGLIGWLDGVPATDRDAANRLMLDRYRTEITGRLNSLTFQPDTGPQGIFDRTPDDGNGLTFSEYLEQKRYLETQLQGLDKVQAKLGELGDQGLLLGLDLSGDGRSIIAVGDPDTAAHTAVWVPGLGTDVATDTNKDVNRVRDLQQAATAITGDPKSVAGIMWLGYDAPEIESSRLNGSVATADRSVEGGAALDRFVDGLRATHTGDTHTHLTVEGHSYGSTVVAQSSRLAGGLAADDVITVGSPGVQADRAADLGIPAGHMWAASADGDPVSGWVGHIPGVHGNEPTDDDFGANRFTTDTQGHSDYWRPNSATLRNQAAIITGRYGAVDLMHGSAPTS